MSEKNVPEAASDHASRLLLIEDDADDAVLVQECLNGQGDSTYLIERVATLGQARQALAKNHYDLILLDLNLPDSHGAATLACVIDARPEIPVIVLTDLAGPGLSRKCIQGGAQAYLPKDSLTSTILAQLLDLSLRQERLEESLQQAQDLAVFHQEQFNDLIHHSPEAILIVAEDGTIRHANPAAETLHGLSHGELIGSHFDYPLRRNTISEQEITRRDGLVRTVEMFAVDVRWNNAPCAYVTLRDITPLHDAQADLEENRRLVQAFEDTDQAIVALLEPDGVLREINRFGRDLLGYGPEDVGRLNWFQDVASPGRANGGDPLQADTNSLYPRGANCPARTRTGQDIPVRWYDAPLRNARGILTGRLVIGHDLTEQFEIERQLRQAHKMQAVGELSGGLAHDFNNILTAILGNAQILEMEFTPDQAGYEELQQIIQAAHRAADLTSKLLSFSRKHDFAPEPINLHDIIDETVTLLKRTIDPLVLIETRFDCDEPLILGDSAELQSALLNLGLNARDAMANGGTLRYSTTRCEITASDSRVTELNIQPGQYIQLQVTDTGAGMAPEVRERIFEPFFTTKENKKGTGLGLSNTYRCISDHHGHIRVDSQPGLGTSFHIYLPLRTHQVAPSIPAENRPPKPIRATVMLVDDDTSVRHTQARLLEHLHCHVLQASSGQESIDLFNANREEIDLIFLDRQMPGLDGLETLRQLRQIDPVVPILICSGQGPCDKLQALLGEGTCGLLPKPFDIQQIRQSLQKHLFSS